MTDELNADELNRNLRRHLEEHSTRHPRSLTPGGSRSGPKWWVEWDATRDLVKGLERDGVRRIRDVVPRQATSPETPPDVLGRNEAGGLIGFEVTELVDERVININVPRSKWLAAALPKARTSQERIQAMYAAGEVNRLWTSEEVLEAVTEIVAEKDAKPFAEDGEPYAERWLVIHTDEPFLRFDHLELALARTFEVRQFDAAYIIMGYAPDSETYPWRRVRLNKGVGSQRAGARTGAAPIV